MSTSTIVSLLASPIKDWSSQTSDAWLQEQLGMRVDLNDPWQEVIAVGMLLRYDHGEGDVKEKVAAILAGRYSPRKERVWVQQVPRVAVSTLIGWAISTALLVTEALEALSEEAAVEDEGWRQAVVRQAERRDELEGIRSLMGARGDGSEEALERMQGWTVRRAYDGGMPALLASPSITRPAHALPGALAG